MSLRIFNLLIVCVALISTLSISVDAQVIEWGHTWGADGNYDQTAQGGVAVDSSGDVYIAGVDEIDPQKRNGSIVKFDPEGNHLWSLIWDYSRNEVFNDIAIGPNGNVYVVGWSSSYALLAAFDEDGNLLWDRIFGNPDGQFSYRAWGIDVDGEGNVYVAGDIYNGEDYDAFIANFDSSGSMKWIKQLKPLENEYWEDARDVAFYEDDSGSFLYVTGRWRPGVAPIAYAILVKIDLTSMEIKWVSGVTPSTYYVAVDSSGSPWTAGWYEKSGVLIKMDPGTGDVTYSAKITHSGYPNTKYYDIHVSGDDDIYLAGDLDEEALLTKLDISDSGIQPLWSLKWGGSDTDIGYASTSHDIYAYLAGKTHSPFDSISSEILEPIIQAFGETSEHPSFALVDISCTVEDPSATISFIENPVIDNVVGSDAFVLKVSSSPDIYALVRGKNNKIYRNSYYLRDDIWRKWIPLPSGTTPSGIAAARHEGILHLVVRGTNNKIYYGRLEELTGAFTGWSQVGGTTPSKPAIAIDQGSGYLWVAVRGMDDGIYIKGMNLSTGDWSEWERLPGKTSEAPAIAAHNDMLHIVVKGVSDNSLWHGIYDIGLGEFLGWNKVSGATPSAPDLAVDSRGYIYLAVRGMNDKIYINRYDGSSWLGWEQIPTGTTAQGPAIAFDSNDNLHVMVTSSAGDGRIYHCYKDSNTNTWTSWSRLIGATPSEPELT